MEKKWDTVIPADLEKTLCKWDMYVPLVTKGLKVSDCVCCKMLLAKLTDLFVIYCSLPRRSSAFAHFCFHRLESYKSYV